MLPQIILIVLYAMTLGLSIAKHGEPREYTNHNAWTSLLAIIILFGLLWLGGFFNVFVK